MRNLSSAKILWEIRGLKIKGGKFLIAAIFQSAKKSDQSRVNCLAETEIDSLAFVAFAKFESF
jgi:hypothetical protein